LFQLINTTTDVCGGDCQFKRLKGINMSNFIFHNKLGAFLTCIILFCTTISSANAGLIINTNFTGGANAGNAVGTGNLVSIFNTAADVWESLIQDDHTLNINFSWAALGGGTLGVHNLTGQGGSPNRETSANIRFDNDGTSIFYMDDTPLDNSEWATETLSNADLGGGNINIGRVFSGATGFAANGYDLYSVALHEIGHALGLSSANVAFQAGNGDLDIDVISGPFAGSVIPTISGAHLNLSTSLMYPFFGLGARKLISEADLWANCSISQFTDCGTTDVPEPSTIAIFALGIMGLASRRFKKQ